MYVIEWFYWRALVHGTCETWESGIIFCYSSKIKFNHIILKQNPCNQIILTIYLKFKKDQTALKPGRFKRDANKIRISEIENHMSHEFTSFMKKSSFKLHPLPPCYCPFFLSFFYFVSYLYVVVQDGKKFFSNKTTRELNCLQLIQLFSPCIFFAFYTFKVHVFRTIQNWSTDDWGRKKRK